MAGFSQNHNCFMASKKINFSRVKRLVMDFTVLWKFNLKINHTVTKKVKAIYDSMIKNYF